MSLQPQRKVLAVQIHSPCGVVHTYAALDAGSDSTIIRRDLADHLRLSGETHQTSLNSWIQGPNCKPSEFVLVI